MRKLSYAFSGRVLAGKAAKNGILSILILLAPLALHGEEQPDYVPAPPPAGERAFQLERVEPSKEIRVGDRLVFVLDAPDAESLALKTPSDQSAAAISEAGWQVYPGRNPQEIIVIPMKPGSTTLPSLSVTPKEPADAPSVGITVPVTMQVVSAIAPDDPKPQEPAPLRPPARVSLPLWVWIAAVCAALALLGAIAWLLIRLSRRSAAQAPVATPPKPVLPEDVVALETLNAIAAADWIAKGAYKTHYFAVSEVLKTYFGARYRFDARESTTAELLRALDEKAAAGDSVIDRVEGLFAKLDLVKFTDHLPHVAEGAAVLEEARALVRLTRRPPPIAPATSTVTGGPH